MASVVLSSFRVSMIGIFVSFIVFFVRSREETCFFRLKASNNWKSGCVTAVGNCIAHNLLRGKSALAPLPDLSPDSTYEQYPVQDAREDCQGCHCGLLSLPQVRTWVGISLSSLTGCSIHAAARKRPGAVVQGIESTAAKSVLDGPDGRSVFSLEHPAPLRRHPALCHVRPGSIDGSQNEHGDWCQAHEVPRIWAQKHPDTVLHARWEPSQDRDQEGELCDENNQDVGDR